MRTITSLSAAAYRVMASAMLASTVVTYTACRRSSPSHREVAAPQSWLEALVLASVDVHPLARDIERSPLVLDLAVVRAAASSAGLAAPDSAGLAAKTKRAVISVDRATAIVCSTGGCAVLSNGLLFVLNAIEQDSLGLGAAVEYVTTATRGGFTATCNIPVNFRLVLTGGAWRVVSMSPSRLC